MIKEQTDHRRTDLSVILALDILQKRLPRGPRMAESLQVARVRQCGRQRFRQRCQVRSDSRGNLPGPTRPATALRCYEFPKEHCDPSGTSMLRSFGITMRHPREGGDPSGVVVRGRGFSLVWSVTWRVGPGKASVEITGNVPVIQRLCETALLLRKKRRTPLTLASLGGRRAARFFMFFSLE